MRMLNMKDYMRHEQQLQDNDDNDDFWTFKESLGVAAIIAAMVFIFMFLPWVIRL